MDLPSCWLPAVYSGAEAEELSAIPNAATDGPALPRSGLGTSIHRMVLAL